MAGLCSNPTIDYYLGPDDYTCCNYRCTGVRSCAGCLCIFITFLILLILATMAF